MSCKWCKGYGYLYVEKGSSLSYACPDCNGSGQGGNDEEDELDTCYKCGVQQGHGTMWETEDPDQKLYCDKCYNEE